MENNLNILQILIGEWQSKTFGKVDPKGQLNKLCQEANELRIINEINWQEKSEEIESEAADVAIVLFGFCEKMGFSLAKAIDEKMAINRARKWGPARDDGTYQQLT